MISIFKIAIIYWHILLLIIIKGGYKRRWLINEGGL